MNIALEPKPNALLIEDNADDRLNIKLQLEVMGFNVLLSTHVSLGCRVDFRSLVSIAISLFIT